MMQIGKYRLTISLSPLRQALSWLAVVITDRKVLALLGILVLGAYLRLWNIEHLFNILHDYDEGAYALGARFTSQGYLPYQDFLLVHPPLYNLVLALVYKIFGYSFFYGRYLSVALSLVCIILIYLVGKKMYHSGAGLVAAALFAVSPMLMYLGRRSVQEILGVFLILVATYLAFDFIKSGKQNRLLWCGLTLGLAVATKYLFIPAAVGIILAVILLNMGKDFWESIKSLGRPMFWLVYTCFAAIFYSLVLLSKWVLNINISVPFLDPMYLSAGDLTVVVLVFVLPLLVSVALLGKKLPVKEWWLGLWGLRSNKGLWLLIGGVVLGFLSVTGFFWVKMPEEFVYQTVVLQQSRPMAESPSLLAIIRLAPLNTGFLRMISLPILLIIPFIFIILNKKDFSRSDCFLVVVLITSFTLCQGFSSMPRYYVSLFPFLFLAISWLVSPVNVKMVTDKLMASVLVVLAILLLFLNLSVILLRNYTGYDTLLPGPVFSSIEERMYEETLDYLEEAEAKKIYATSPSFPAMSSNLQSAMTFDIFALLWLEKKPPEQIVKDLIDEGVDYVLLDSWIRYWGGPKKEQATELAQHVRLNSRLVKVIQPNSQCRVDIYQLGVEAEGIFNGDFKQWVTEKETRLPLGWSPVLIGSEGDETSISQAYIAGKECASFTIYEDGMRNDIYDSTYAGISQQIPFPETKLKIEVFPTVNTATTGRVILGSGIHFIDEHGHALIIGFSDEVSGEEVVKYGDDNRMLVVKNAQLSQWSEHTIDLLAYWNQAGWWQPPEVNMVLAVSTYYTEPGYYTLHIAKVEAEDTKAGTSGQ